MADIGILPSKTKIEVTSSTGDRGIISAATPAAAGCMTAEQASQLDQLWSGKQSDAGMLILHPVQQPNTVTHDQFRSAVEGLRRMMVERASIHLPALTADSSMMDRIVHLEQQADNFDARIASLAEAISGLADVQEANARLIEQRLADFERSVPSIDGIKMIRGAA